MAHHVAKGIIEKANTKGLADDPGMQMQPRFKESG